MSKALCAAEKRRAASFVTCPPCRSQAMLDPSAVRPTRVRHLVVAVTTLMAVLLYLDRFCISFVEGLIREDLRLSGDEMGWVLSAFFWSYALAQVPSGWLSDRFGPRRMLTAYVVLWSLFTALTGLVTGLIVLIAVRLGFGLGQAGAYPTAAGMLSKWIPFAHRATASSVVAFGGRVGGFLAPVLTAYLLVALVPVKVSSLLTADDLLDAPRLCHRLSQAEAATPTAFPPLPAPPGHVRSEPSAPAVRWGQRIMSRLPPTVRQTVHEYAGISATALEETKRRATQRDAKARTQDPQPPAPSPTRRLADPLTRPSAALSPTEVHALRIGLNDVLQRRDFAQQADLRDVPLSVEAKRLLHRPRAELSDLEVQRLNRLLLEAVYPAEIRKIYVHGWRSVMLLYAAAGLAVAGTLWLCIRDRPADHRCNAAELALIQQGRPAAASGDHDAVGAIPFARLLASRSMWLSCASQWGINVGWVFLVTWLPRYLDEVHRVPIVTRGWMASLPLFAAWVGMLSGGRLADRLTRLLGLRWGRCLPMAASAAVAMTAYLVCLLPLSPWAATAAFCAVALATDLGVAAIWAFMQDVGGRHVGSILGWGNMWGNFGAAISPILVNAVVRHYDWDYAFLTCAAAYLLASLCALGIDARIPIAPRDEARVNG